MHCARQPPFLLPLLPPRARPVPRDSPGGPPPPLPACPLTLPSLCPPIRNTTTPPSGLPSRDGSRGPVSLCQGRNASRGSAGRAVASGAPGPGERLSAVGQLDSWGKWWLAELLGQASVLSRLAEWIGSVPLHQPAAPPPSHTSCDRPPPSPKTHTLPLPAVGGVPGLHACLFSLHSTPPHPTLPPACSQCSAWTPCALLRPAASSPRSPIWTTVPLICGEG